MNKIQYHYTNLAKQIFILICFLYILLRFIIMVEIIVYKIEGYYEATNIPLTLLLLRRIIYVSYLSVQRT